MYGQEEILMTLIQGQEGKAWALERNGWTDHHSEFVCRWDYIECDSYQTTVIGIHMIEADFVGTLPTELGNLLTLQEISFRRNLLIGSIPTELANLPHLEKVLLSENRLTGTIPTFVSYKLKTLDLNYNLLTGSLDPRLFWNNNQLTELDLASNQFTGVLPTFLPQEKYYKLMTLSFSDNHFTGTIPSYFANSDTLTYLYLDGNNLMGTIPTEFSEETSSSLEELWLQNNQLTGTIPPSIGEMSTLFNFYVDGNKLTGAVPSSLCRPDINADFFQHLESSPSPPHGEDPPSPTMEDRNYCDSIACPAGTVSLEGVYPCRPCQNSYSNPYLGRVNQCIDLVELDILRSFYVATMGNQWINMETPWDLQQGTYCEQEGIECGNHGNVISLKLKGKGLRGTIPEEIGFLKYLEELDLSDNHLEGILPSDLRWGPLRYLDVSQNQIKGIIPHTLCRKEGINQNGRNGNFDCDFVQCPAGTHSKLGRATKNSPCKPCRRGMDTPFVGSTKCTTLFHVPHHLRAFTEEHNVAIPIFVVMLMITGIYVSCFAAIDQTIVRLENDDDDDDTILDERILTSGANPQNDEEDPSTRQKPYRDVPEENNLMSFEDTKGKTNSSPTDTNLISLDDDSEKTMKTGKKSLINFEEESEIVGRQEDESESEDDESEEEDGSSMGDHDGNASYTMDHSLT